MSALTKLSASVDALATLATRGDAPQRELLDACAALDGTIVPQLAHMVARAKEVDPERRTYGPKTSASILALAEKLAAVEPIIREKAAAAAALAEQQRAAEAARLQAEAVALEEQRRAAAAAAQAEAAAAAAARAAQETAAAEQLRRANERLKAEQDARRRAKAKANQADAAVAAPAPVVKAAAVPAAAVAPSTPAPVPPAAAAAAAAASSRSVAAAATGAAAHTPVAAAPAPVAAAAPVLQPGRVIHAASEAEFERVRTAARDGDKLLVIDFSATWCGPCRAFAPTYDAIAKATPDVVFMHVNCDLVPAVGDRFRVHAFPTFHMYWRGDLQAQFSGASAAQLQTAMDACNAKIDDVLTQEAIKASMDAESAVAASADEDVDAAELAAALKMSTDAGVAPAGDVEGELAAALRLSMEADAAAARGPAAGAAPAADDDDEDLAVALRLSMATDAKK